MTVVKNKSRSGAVKRLEAALDTGQIKEVMNLISDLSAEALAYPFNPERMDEAEVARLVKERQSVLRKYLGRMVHNTDCNKIGLVTGSNYSANPDRTKGYIHVDVIVMGTKGEMTNTTWSTNKIVLLSQSTMEFFMVRYNVKM